MLVRNVVCIHFNTKDYCSKIITSHTLRRLRVHRFQASKGECTDYTDYFRMTLSLVTSL